ncbi:hypothetical protein D3C83_94280 [compost metagenome]
MFKKTFEAADDLPAGGFEGLLEHGLRIQAGAVIRNQGIGFPDAVPVCPGGERGRDLREGE